jgi:hypothetical protein
MKILPILICGLVVGLLQCTKEYSCEGCYEQPTLPPDTIRTTPNPLIINVDVSLADESKIRKVYQEVKTKKWPGHYWLYDSITLTGSHLYNRMYDMKNYLDLNDYKIGDTFYFRTQIRYRFEPAEWINQDTLIY